MEFVRKLFAAIFTEPLRFIYKNGPGVFLLWEGVSDESICYEITSVDSTFWSSNDETVNACSDIIERKSNAFIIAVYLSLGTYSLYTLANLLIYRYFFMSYFSALVVDRIEDVKITMSGNQYTGETGAEKPAIEGYEREKRQRKCKK